MRHVISATILAVLAASFLTPGMAAEPHRHGGPAGRGGTLSSPYAGEEKRAIKTLSASDIDDLRNGRGWGFAKAAELNGLPGPTHLLEMKTEIGLSPAQIEAVEALFAEMKAEAILLGVQLVELERELDRAFADKDIDETDLKARIEKIAAVHGNLRYVHLAAHLRTPALLSAAQIADYNRLRGYDLQPSNPPSGHSHGK